MAPFLQNISILAQRFTHSLARNDPTGYNGLLFEKYYVSQLSIRACAGRARAIRIENTTWFLSSNHP